jgi:hypothetical protein
VSGERGSAHTTSRAEPALVITPSDQELDAQFRSLFSVPPSSFL